MLDAATKVVVAIVAAVAFAEMLCVPVHVAVSAPVFPPWRTTFPDPIVQAAALVIVLVDVGAVVTTELEAEVAVVVSIAVVAERVGTCLQDAATCVGYYPRNAVAPGNRRSPATYLPCSLDCAWAEVNVAAGRTESSGTE